MWRGGGGWGGAPGGDPGGEDGDDPQDRAEEAREPVDRARGRQRNALGIRDRQCLRRHLGGDEQDDGESDRDQQGERKLPPPLDPPAGEDVVAEKDRKSVV